MSNMGYCRFENTLSDLRECYDHLFDKDMSKDERHYRLKLIELCQQIGEGGGYMLEDENENND